VLLLSVDKGHQAGRRLFAHSVAVALIASSFSIAQVAHTNPALADSGSPPTYRIEDLGTLGGLTSAALAINQAGDVAGWAQLPGTPGRQVADAFLYHNGSPQDLGTLGATPQNSVNFTGSLNLSEARAINDLGAMAGVAQDATHVPLPFDYTTGMSNVAPNGSSGFAEGINNFRAVVGLGQTPCDPNAVSCPQYPFVWTPTVGWRDLYTFGCNLRTQDQLASGDAFGVNDAGVIVGQEPMNGQLGTEAHHAFRCIEASNGTYAATDLGPSESTDSAAFAINRWGVMAGKADTGGGPIQAVVWAPDLHTSELGVAPAAKIQPGFESVAYAINDAGDAVGKFGLGAGGNFDVESWSRAFLWHDGSMTDLNDLLPSGSGWTLLSAHGINNNGQIVGRGLINVAQHAFRLTPSTNVDIVATDMEVTQAIQDLANDVPLVATKRTFVRVYAHTDSHPVGGVSARLFGTRLDSTPSNSPLEQHGGIITQQSSRMSTFTTFLFELPQDWITPGPLTLRAEVNYDQHVAETNYGNDALVRTVTFFPAAFLKVRLIDISYPSAGGVSKPLPEDDAALASLIGRMYPSKVFIDHADLPLQVSPGTIGGYPGLWLLLSDLKSQMTWAPDDLQTIWYGSIPYVQPLPFHFGITGMGSSGVAVGDSPLPYTGAHEIGHALGEAHAPGCWAYSPTGTFLYPYPDGRIGGPVENPDKYVGFDSLTQRPVAPTAFDIMNYCSPQWISDYRYERLYNAIRVLSGAAPAIALTAAPRAASNPGASNSTGAQTSAGEVSVVGMIDFTTETAQLPFVARIAADVSTTPIVAGPYHVQLSDARGSILADYPFTPSPALDGSNAPSGLIKQIVPFLSGTALISIWSDKVGHNIASINVAPIGPTIAVAAPTAGTSLPATGPVTIAWSGTAAPGSSLTYTVAYSRDDGLTWEPIAARLSGTSVTIDAARLAGTSASGGRFRIVANDGVNTVSADTGSLTVPGKVPTMDIASPLSGTSYTTDQAITLDGTGSDPQDGTLSDSQLSWSSNLDGPLGTGATLVGRHLSAGTHTITLTGTDSEGLTATATMVVTVAAPQVGPVLGVEQSEFNVLYVRNSPSQNQSVAIDNLGTGVLFWSASSDSPWLALDKNVGTAPAVLTMHIDTSALPVGGTQVAHVTVKAPGASTGEQVVTVVAQSADQPVMLTPSAIGFGLQAVGGVGQPQAVTMDYAGAANLNIGTVALAGAAPEDFVIVKDGCSHQAIPSGSTCTIFVNFRPTKPGDRLGYLVLPDANSSAKWYVAMSGQGATNLVRSVLAWGLNTFGEVGASADSNQDCYGFPCVPLPHAVTGPPNIVAVAAGRRHSLAVGADGSVWAWGYNLYGQLGIGTQTPDTCGQYSCSPTPNPVPVQVKGLTDVVAVAAGSDHSLALKKDGTVWAWGRNQYGEIGDGSTANRALPVEVPGPGGSGHLTNVIAVAADEANSYALRSDGTAWSWGYALGLGNGDLSHGNVPTQVKGLSNVIAISYEMALKADGTVWTWGVNISSSGAACSSDPFKDVTRTPVEVTDGDCGAPFTDVVAIASGGLGDERFALKRDGTVWAWGGGNKTFLGVGDCSDPSSCGTFFPLPVEGPGGVGQLTDIVAMQPGIALRNDGTVWGWGPASHGARGDGSVTDQATAAPVQVKGIGGNGNLAGVVAMAASIDHRLVITTTIGSPGTVAIGTFSRPPDKNGWYNHPVSLSWTSPDTAAKCDPPVTYSGPDGAAITLTGHCTDPSGTTGIGAVTLNYDSTPPTIQVAGVEDGATYRNSVTPIVTVQDLNSKGKTDGTSGVDPSQTTMLLDGVPFATGTPVTRPGPHVLQISAADLAGNRANVLIKFTVKHTTSLRLDGATGGDYHDPAILAAALLDTATNPAIPIRGATVTLNVDQQTCSATTDAVGEGTCTLVPNVPMGNYALGAAFVETAFYLGSSSAGSFAVTKEETVLTIGSSPAQPNASQVTLRATLSEDGQVPIAGRTITFLTNGLSATGITDANGVATTMLALPVGKYALTVAFGSDAYYMAATASQTLYVYQPTQFVIWGGNAPNLSDAIRVGQDYLFWGPEWASQVTGGDFQANPAFKGYADQVTGATWETRPANSSRPPDSVASYIGVIVATHVRRQGATTTGNVAELVVLQVDNPSNYKPDPGHVGTGVMVLSLVSSPNPNSLPLDSQSDIAPTSHGLIAV
jgi:probable HAF family extracellular repeat protein